MINSTVVFRVVFGCGRDDEDSEEIFMRPKMRRNELPALIYTKYNTRPQCGIGFENNK
jgi:hypothetical protein